MDTKTIFHIDINHCYAQIEEMRFPKLRDIPMAVGGHEETRHGIILAKNDLAKKAGVKTGQSLREAYQTCPDLLIIPPHYEDYIYYTEQVKQIYREYSDHVESFGLDEAWVDYTASKTLFGDGYQVAKEIQQRVYRELGLSVSIGISWNKIFAKFGSDLIKPFGLTEITKQNYQELVWPHKVEDLLYVGPATKYKLNQHGIYNIRDLAQVPKETLKYLLGIQGEVLHAFANGEEESEVLPWTFTRPPKSVGNSMTMIRDVDTLEDLKAVYYVLCESVASRLKEVYMEGSVISISLRDNQLHWYGKQRKREQPTCVSFEICKDAMELVKELYDFKIPLRAIGVSVSSLQPIRSFHQLSLFETNKQHSNGMELDRAMDTIRDQFGFYAIRRAITLVDQALTECDPKQEHTIHPVGYFQGRRMKDGII